MAIGNSYPIDKDVEDKDLVLGTDYGSNRTVNFPMEDIAGYLNRKGKISIGGQTTWKFVTSNPIGGTISLIDGAGNGLPFSGLTYLIMSIEDMSAQRVVEFIDYLVGGEVLLVEQKKTTQFGHYRLLSYEISDDPLFYIATLGYIGGNGNIKENGYYDFLSFVPKPEGEDKTFVFTQNAATNPWYINHNLNKFPSVSMVLSTGQMGVADVTYIDANNLTITFSGDESGKAYLN
jgi:hypothetical protein